MWTLIFIYAFRALTAPPWEAPLNEPAGAVSNAPTAPAEMSIEEIAAVEPMVRQYLNAARDAEGQLANLRTALGENHPRVREVRCRARVMGLRADEFAARYRQNPKALRAYQDPEIRKSLDAIDRIDIEMEMLRPNAGPTHPRLRTLRHYRDQHQRRIEQVLGGGAA